MREEARSNRLPNFVPILPARNHVQPVPKTKAVLVLACCTSTIGTRGEAAEIDRHDVGRGNAAATATATAASQRRRTNSTAAKPTQAKLSLSAEREPRDSTAPLGCCASQTVRETSDSASRCSRIALHSAVIVVVASHVSATCSKFPLVLHPRGIVVAVPVHDCDELLAHILCAPERARLHGISTVARLRKVNVTIQLCAALRAVVKHKLDALRRGAYRRNAATAQVHCGAMRSLSMRFRTAVCCFSIAPKRLSAEGLRQSRAQLLARL